MTEHCNYTPDIFFLSLCLFFGTFFLASFLKKFKFTSFFPNKVCVVDILGICKLFTIYLSAGASPDCGLRRDSDHHHLRGVWSLLRPRHSQAHSAHNIQGRWHIICYIYPRSIYYICGLKTLHVDIIHLVAAHPIWREGLADPHVWRQVRLVHQPAS